MAQIAARQATQPLDVLHDDRPIETQLRPQRGFVGRARARVLQLERHRVARQQAHQHKDDDAHAEQRRHQQCQPPHQVVRHVLTFLEPNA